MFEAAELGHAIDENQYDAEVPELREALLDAQFDLVESRKFAVVIFIAGMDGAGKGDTVNMINEWMDPRHIQTHAPAEPSAIDRERTPMWRYWQALPARGKIGIFFDALYSEAITARVYGKIKNSELDQALDRISRFEKMLVDEGTLVLKFWLAISRDEQYQRFKARQSIPFKRFKITQDDWRNREKWDQYESAVCDMVERTSTEISPWTLVPANKNVMPGLKSCEPCIKGSRKNYSKSRRTELFRRSSANLISGLLADLLRNRKLLYSPGGL